MKTNRDIAHEVIMMSLADCGLTPDEADQCLADVARDYRIVCDAWRQQGRDTALQKPYRVLTKREGAE